MNLASAAAAADAITCRPPGGRGQDAWMGVFDRMVVAGRGARLRGPGQGGSGGTAPRCRTAGGLQPRGANPWAVQHGAAGGGGLVCVATKAREARGVMPAAGPGRVDKLVPVRRRDGARRPIRQSRGFICGPMACLAAPGPLFRGRRACQERKRPGIEPGLTRETGNRRLKTKRGCGGATGRSPPGPARSRPRKPRAQARLTR